MTQYSNSLRAAAILTDLHAHLRLQQPPIGLSPTARLRTPISIMLPFGDWLIVKAALADAINGIERPTRASAEPPKRPWWRAGPDRSQDIKGALAMLAGSGIGVLILVVAAACTVWN